MVAELHRELHGQGLKKREAKQQAKRLLSIRLYFEAELKPMKIASILKVEKEFVYQSVKKFKNDVKKLDSEARQIGSERLQPIDTFIETKHQSKEAFFEERQQAILAKISDYIDSKGVHQISLERLRQHLLKSLPSKFKAPHLNEISSLLRWKFHLRFGKFDPAYIRYRDPDHM